MNNGAPRPFPLFHKEDPSMTLVINNKMKRFLGNQSFVLKILKGPMSIFSWNKNPTNKWGSQICKHLSRGQMELTCLNKGFAYNVENMQMFFSIGYSIQINNTKVEYFFKNCTPSQRSVSIFSFDDLMFSCSKIII